MMDGKHQQIGPESAAPRNTPQHDRSPRMSAPDHTSTARPSPIDIDTLAAWLIEYRHPIQNALTRPHDGLTMLRTDRNFFVCHDALTDAAALVASSWLAGVIGSVKAEALREAARYFEYEAAPAWGGDATWISTGAHVADLVAEHLRDRAASLESEAGR